MNCKVTEIMAKSILQKSKLPESDYCVNPYIGCAHQCIYCYARFMGRFTGHAKEKWGEYIDVRTNSAELMKKEIKKIGSPDDIIFLGSVTDVYQPIEIKYKLTRQILEILKDNDAYTVLQTKSNLILRDIDILKQFKRCEVGFTITSLDDNIRKMFEPYSSNVESRLESLKNLKLAGIKTYAFIGPIIPNITNVDSILKRISGIVDYVMGESLNIRCGNWEDIKNLLIRNFPKIETDEYKKLINNGEYWASVEKEYLTACKKYSIKSAGFFSHKRDKKVSN